MYKVMILCNQFQPSFEMIVVQEKKSSILMLYPRLTTRRRLYGQLAKEEKAWNCSSDDEGVSNEKIISFYMI